MLSHGLRGRAPNMSNYALSIGLIAAIVLHCAWREYANDNRRDAKLLAAVGAGGMLTAAAWLV